MNKTDPRHPLNRLRHHVTGAIERGEAEPVTQVSVANQDQAERRSAHTPTPNASKAFYIFDKSPANAVALAREDHRAHSGQASDEFTAALHKAEAQCRAHDELVAALRDIADAAYGTDTPKLRARARAALAKAGAV